MRSLNAAAATVSAGYNITEAGVSQPRYELPPAQAVSLTLLWSVPASRPSRQAHSFRTSTSSTVTAAPLSTNTLLSSQITFKMPRRMLSSKSLRRFYVTRLDHISLSFLPIRTLPPPYRTRTGRCCYSQRPNANLLQSSLNAGDPVARRDGLVTQFVRYCTAKRSIVTCDSTFRARYLIFLSSVLLSCLRRIAASLSTGLPTYYATYVQILM